MKIQQYYEQIAKFKLHRVKFNETQEKITNGMNILVLILSFSVGMLFLYHLDFKSERSPSQFLNLIYTSFVLYVYLGMAIISFSAFSVVLVEQIRSKHFKNLDIRTRVANIDSVRNYYLDVQLTQEINATSSIIKNKLNKEMTALYIDNNDPKNPMTG